MLCANKLMLQHKFMFIPTIKLKDKHIQLKDEETEIGTTKDEETEVNCQKTEVSISVIMRSNCKCLAAETVVSSIQPAI